MSELASVDLTNPEFVRDPHPTYAHLREHSPVHRVMTPNGLSTWLITRYAEAREALANPALSKDIERHLPPDAFASDAAVRMTLARHMLNTDPPDHTRLRRLVSKAFTMRRVESLRPRVQEITDELLDALPPGGADLLSVFAFPLPITVICELLGVPLTDRDEFRQLSNTAVEGPGADLPRFLTAMGALKEYTSELVTLKRATPADDLLSDLIAVRDDGDRLSEDELTSMIFLLLIAGHETTVNLIGNGVLSLLTHPDELARLRAAPELLPSAIEEFLRFDGPVETSTMRFAVNDLTIGDVTIPAGDPVLIVLSAANRDPARFADPDALDIGRTDNPHVAFGHGIHFCLGAALARLEGQVALGSLLARLPSLALASPPSTLQWRPGLLLRGLTALPVTY